MFRDNSVIFPIAVDRAGTQGCVYTSTALLLMYLMPYDNLLYILDFADVRKQLPRWVRAYPTRQIPNHGYCTHGLLVPLVEREKLALWVGTVPK